MLASRGDPGLWQQCRPGHEAVRLFRHLRTLLLSSGNLQGVAYILVHSRHRTKYSFYLECSGANLCNVFFLRRITYLININKETESSKQRALPSGLINRTYLVAHLQKLRKMFNHDETREIDSIFYKLTKSLGSICSNRL